MPSRVAGDNSDDCSNSLFSLQNSADYDLQEQNPSADQILHSLGIEDNLSQDHNNNGRDVTDCAEIASRGVTQSRSQPRSVREEPGQFLSDRDTNSAMTTSLPAEGRYSRYPDSNSDSVSGSSLSSPSATASHQLAETIPEDKPPATKPKTKPKIKANIPRNGLLETPIPNTTNLRQLLTKLSQGAQSKNNPQPANEKAGFTSSSSTDIPDDRGQAISLPLTRLIDEKDTNLHAADRSGSPDSQNVLSATEQQSNPSSNILTNSQESLDRSSQLENNSHSAPPIPLSELPKPVSDNQLDLANEEPLLETPEPPPEFLTEGDSYHPSRPDAQMSCSCQGIQGSMDNSSFMESILYLMSVSTDLFALNSNESQYSALQKLLRKDIRDPLVNDEMVESAVMSDLRHRIDELSVGQLLRTGGQRDVQKFVRLLLEHLIGLRPLYELNNDQTGYTMTLTSYKDARVGFPTVQKLLEKTCIQQQVKFNEAPMLLILLLPRWTTTEEKIFPNLHIDLTDVLEYAIRICHMCGEAAMFECPECYETEHTELSSAAFCERCSNTIHKHSKRANHMPIQLRTADSPRSLSSQVDGSPILKLIGVLSLRNSHYTCLSEPYVESAKKLSESQTLVDESDWLLFDSKANIDTDSGAYLPEVRKMWGTAKWLSMDGYEHMAKDMASVPAHIRDLLVNCAVCFYTRT